MANENAGDLCVKSKVKEVIKSSDMNCAGDVFDALGQVVTKELTQAIGRAKANGRKTVKGYDIFA